MKHNHNVTPLCGTSPSDTPPSGTPTLYGGKPSNITIDSPVGFDPANSTGLNPMGYQRVGALVGGAPVGGAPVGGAPVGGAPVGGAPVGKVLLGKALLAIGLIGIMLAGCNDSGSGSGGSGNGNGNGGGNGSGDTTGVYTCANGTPVTGSPDGTADVEDCKLCRTNYVLIHGNRCVRRGTYTCTNGTAATGSPDGTTDVERCMVCQSNYFRDVLGRCIDKGSYTCANGTPVSGSPSGATNVEQCMSCRTNYILVNGNRCVQKGSFTCTNGIPATGSPSGTTDVERCASCHTNYFRDAAGRCVTCASTLAGPSDATHDGEFLCGAYSQVKVPLSNESMYIIYTNLSANSNSITLFNAQNQAEYMQTCPYTSPENEGVTATACESPPDGQMWFVMPLESGTHTLRLLNTANSNGGSYKIAVREYGDASFPRLPLNQSITLETGDPTTDTTNNFLNFWAHFPPNRSLQSRVPQIDTGAACSLTHGPRSRLYTGADNRWFQAVPEYSTSTLALVYLQEDSSTAGKSCQMHLRF